MTDTTPPPSATDDWPTSCPLCHTTLESHAVDLRPDSEREWSHTGTPGAVIAEDFCPNPDCPGKRDGATGPADEATTPGSLGGDNGGA